MPIDYKIDHHHRLVRAAARGTLEDHDVFTFQKEAWSRPDVAGYDELVDMTAVEHIVLPSVARVRELARLATSMDRPQSVSSKVAIAAPSDVAYGLGRMYEAYRSHAAAGTKQIGVFRSLAEALAFLGRDSDSGPGSGEHGSTPA